MSSLTDRANKSTRGQDNAHLVWQNPCVHPMPASIWLINTCDAGRNDKEMVCPRQTRPKEKEVRLIKFLVLPERLWRHQGEMNWEARTGSLHSGSQQPCDLPSVFPFRCGERPPRPPLLRPPLSLSPMCLSLPMQGHSQTQWLLSHREWQPGLGRPRKGRNTNARSRLERRGAEIWRHITQPIEIT